MHSAILVEGKGRARWSEGDQGQTAQLLRAVTGIARGYRGDLSVRVCAGIFRVWDQPIDRPALDLVGRPRPLISGAVSRACARTRYRRGSVGAGLLGVYRQVPILDKIRPEPVREPPPLKRYEPPRIGAATADVAAGPAAGSV
jgi:hypothetical protein